MQRQRTDCENFHRRDFLHVGGLSLLGLGLPRLLACEAAGPGAGKATARPARNVILIWLAGGPSTIDMWDLKPQAPVAVRGEFKPVDTSADGIRICEHLPKIARQMHACTLVRSLTHTIAEHRQGTGYLMTGNPVSPALQYPSPGSIVSARLDTQPCSPADLSATLLSQLGIAPDTVLHTRSGRPVQVFREGRILDGIIG